MPELSELISLDSFDPALMSLSFLISVFGALCGLTCVARARRRAGLLGVLWVVGAAVSLGGGAIWSMHFIGMLAYRSKLIYTLDVKITLLSLAIAVGAALIGVAIATAAHDVPGYVFGGLVTGGGVAAMHYTGQYAMTMNGTVSYRTDLVAISVAVAIIVTPLAFFLGLRRGRARSRAFAAALMGLGVCATHYLAMSAMTTTPSHDLDMGVSQRGTDPFSLAMPIFGICSLLLLILVFAGFSDDTVLERADRADDFDAELEPIG